MKPSVTASKAISIGKGTSAFSNRIGQKVAAEGITVVDDGTLDRRRGSLNVDDEGTPTQCTVLIETGILRGYIQDKMNARLMGMPATGNGPPRVLRAYDAAAAHDQYVHARRHPRAGGNHRVGRERAVCGEFLAAGQVDITSGKFVFSASEAYLIENGKITAPVKGATLIGNGPDVLTRVSMVGNDLKLDAGGVGTCVVRKVSRCLSGWVNPTLRVDLADRGRYRLA